MNDIINIKTGEMFITQNSQEKDYAIILPEYHRALRDLEECSSVKNIIIHLFH